MNAEGGVRPRADWLLARAVSWAAGLIACVENRRRIESLAYALVDATALDAGVIQALLRGRPPRREAAPYAPFALRPEPTRSEIDDLIAQLLAYAPEWNDYRLVMADPLGTDSITAFRRGRSRELRSAESLGASIRARCRLFYRPVAALQVCVAARAGEWPKVLITPFAPRATAAWVEASLLASLERVSRDRRSSVAIFAAPADLPEQARAVLSRWTKVLQQMA